MEAQHQQLSNRKHIAIHLSNSLSLIFRLLHACLHVHKVGDDHAVFMSKEVHLAINASIRKYSYHYITM